MNYKKVIAFLNKVEEENAQNERTKLSENEIVKIKHEYKNIPKDYLDYLKYVGYGSFRKCQFMVYGDLMTWADFGVEDENNNLVFFGDNFSGDLSGFNLEKNGKVIEYWHDSGEIYETEQTFYEYIKEKMLMDNDGNDLRKVIYKV